MELVRPKFLPERFKGLSEKTLANLRSLGQGPRYYRRGRLIFYDVADIQEWLTKNPVETSDDCHGY
ncbi:MAG: hypothetical protein C4576_14220 [Desulfobacteraceae bacterium]|nr:MAG: hypothetical protein C4576_14220 [Desulfobacteraceae bacterium]